MIIYGPVEPNFKQQNQQFFYAGELLAKKEYKG